MNQLFSAFGYKVNFLTGLSNSNVVELASETKIARRCPKTDAILINVDAALSRLPCNFKAIISLT